MPHGCACRCEGVGKRVVARLGGRERAFRCGVALRLVAPADGEHGRAEGIDEHLPSALERVPQLVRAQTAAGDGLRQLAEVEVLHEGDCLEVMDPVAHAQALYRARRAAATILRVVPRSRAADNLRRWILAPRSFRRRWRW